VTNAGDGQRLPEGSTAVLSADLKTIFTLEEDGVVRARSAAGAGRWETRLFDAPPARGPGQGGGPGPLQETTFAGACLSPNGLILAVHVRKRKGWQNSVALVDAGTGAVLRTIETRSWPDPMAFSPDGKLLLVQDEGAVDRYVVATGQRLARPDDSPLRGSVTGLAVGPDGSVFVGNSRGVIRFDLPRRDYRVADVGWKRLREIHLSPDGRRLLALSAATAETAVIDSESMARVTTLTGEHPYGGPPAHPPAEFFRDFDRWIWAADSAHVVTVSSWGSVVMREVEKDAASRSAAAPYRDLAPTGDPGVAVSRAGGDDPGLHFWDTGTGAELFRCPLPAGARVIGFDRGNRAMLAAEGNQIVTYRGDGQPVQRFERQPQQVALGKDVACTAAVRPGGTRFVAIAGRAAGLGTTLVWGEITADGVKEIGRMADEHGPECLAFSPDGAVLYVGNEDSTVSIFRTQ
jgi:DNA-binding beta-propeller fold protein YncE